MLWSNGAASGLARVNYVNAYTDTFSPTCVAIAGGCHVSSWATVDVNAGYSFERGTGGRGPRVVLTVQNILNRDPPFVHDGFIGFDPTNANPLGRYFSLMLMQRW